MASASRSRFRKKALIIAFPGELKVKYPYDGPTDTNLEQRIHLISKKYNHLPIIDNII